MAGDLYYLNGQFCTEEQAKVSVLDRAFLFGDAVYEVLRIHHGRAFRVRDHYGRMVRGLSFLGIHVPFSEDDFASLCAQLAARSQVDSGFVYLQVTRGVVERTHLVPADVSPVVMGFARAADLPKWKDHPDGVSAVTTLDLRWQHCDVKTTMLLPNSLAKQKAHEAGAYEAILVDKNGVVHEGSSTNVFAVMNGVLRTHPADHRVLPGITRRIVLDLADDRGIPIAEEPLTVVDLVCAQEVFLTGTVSDVCPVVTLNNDPVGDGRIGPTTRKLIALFEECLERETSGQTT